MRSAVFLLVVCVVFLAGCRPAAAPITVSEKPVSVNDRRLANAAPAAASKPFAEMSWANSQDKVEKLSDHAGKAVILDFWATYCEPCKREIPHLNSLLAKYGRDNLHIVGLNVGGEEDRPKIPAFVASTQIDYEIAFPEDALTNYIFAERSDIPQTAVFDRSGKLHKKIIGFNDQIQKELDEAVEQAVNSR